MAEREVEFDELVGEHVLDGVDYAPGLSTPDVEAMRFRLDGIVYIAMSNESDGYRSSLKSLTVQENNEITNTFPPECVLVRKSNDAYIDTLLIVNPVTLLLIAEVGTNTTDDYYPSFVSSFWPNHLASNQPVGCAAANEV